MAIAAAGVAAAQATLPWPEGDAFEFPGYPDILDGAWYAEAPDAQRPHILLSKDGQVVSNRRNADSSVTIVGYTVTSYMCVDDNTVMFIWKGQTYPSGVDVVSCAAVRIDAKRRAYAAFTQAEGKGCPNPADLDTSASFVVNGNDDIAGYQTYDRVDGVLSGAPVLTCVNSTTPTANPSAVPAPVNFPAYIPEALPAFKGAGTATGVQKTANVLQFTTIDGFYASAVVDAGQGVVGVGGSYLSHDCVPGTVNDYIAAGPTFRTYYNGTGWDQGPSGYHCERGVRLEQGKTTQLQLMFFTSTTNDTDCAPLANAEFRVDETLEVFKEPPGFPTECTSVAGRAVVATGAALVAAVALFLI